MCNLAKVKEKPLYVQIAERDDFADFLRLIPDWVWGAVIWYAFTKIVLDSLSPKKPGTEINLAILLASGIIPDTEVAGLPAGVKLAALIDVSLTALDIGADLWKLKPPGVKPAETLVELGAGPVYAFVKWLEKVTGVSK